MPFVPSCDRKSPERSGNARFAQFCDAVCSCDPTVAPGSQRIISPCARRRAPVLMILRPSWRPRGFLTGCCRGKPSILYCISIYLHLSIYIPLDFISIVVFKKYEFFICDETVSTLVFSVSLLVSIGHCVLPNVRNPQNCPKETTLIRTFRALFIPCHLLPLFLPSVGI